MTYKNSFKLLTNNFSIVWKQLLYLIIISMFSFGIAYCIFLPAMKILISEGVIAQFTDIFETIYTSPSDIVTACKDAFLNLTNVLATNFSKVGVNIIFALFFAKFIFDFLKYISYYNATSVLYMKLTSFLDVGYTRNLISTLGSSVRYAFARVIYNLPFDIILALLFYAFFAFINGTITIIIGLFALISLVVLVLAIKISLFTPQACFMIEYQSPAFKSLFKGHKKVTKSFIKIFSNSIIVVISLIAINIAVGVFTVGAGLTITLPTSLIFICIFNLTSYLGACGERYYLSETLIINSPNNDKDNA